MALRADPGVQKAHTLWAKMAEEQESLADSDVALFLERSIYEKSLGDIYWHGQSGGFEAVRGQLGKVFVWSGNAPAITPAVSEPDKKDRQAREIEQLREQVKQLTFQNQLLQTRVVELRSSLARESRNADKLHMELVAAGEGNAKLLTMQDRFVTLLNDRGRVNDSLVTQMAGVTNGLIRMHESYEGQVESVGDNTAIVVYKVNGDLVEQTYEKSQFKDGKLPPEGVCVKVLVFVVEYEPKPLNVDDLEQSTSGRLDHRKPLTGPDRL